MLAEPAAQLGVEVEALTERSATRAWLRPGDGRSAAVRAAIDGDLATELTASDAPARLLSEAGDHAVVELADRTVGWIAMADVSAVPTGYAPPAIS